MSARRSTSIPVDSPLDDVLRMSYVLVMTNQNAVQIKRAFVIVQNHPQLRVRVVEQLAAGNVLPCDCSKCRFTKEGK